MNEYTNDHAFKRISVQSHRWLEENVIEMLEKKEYSIKRDEIIDVRNQLASILTDVSILQKEVIIDNVKQDEKWGGHNKRTKLYAVLKTKFHIFDRSLSSPFFAEFLLVIYLSLLTNPISG